MSYKDELDKLYKIEQISTGIITEFTLDDNPSSLLKTDSLSDSLPMANWTTTDSWTDDTNEDVYNVVEIKTSEVILSEISQDELETALRNYVDHGTFEDE